MPRPDIMAISLDDFSALFPTEIKRFQVKHRGRVYVEHNWAVPCPVCKRCGMRITGEISLLGGQPACWQCVAFATEEED